MCVVATDIAVELFFQTNPTRFMASVAMSDRDNNDAKTCAVTYCSIVEISKSFCAAKM